MSKEDENEEYGENIQETDDTGRFLRYRCIVESSLAKWNSGTHSVAWRAFDTLSGKDVAWWRITFDPNDHNTNKRIQPNKDVLHDFIHFLSGHPHPNVSDCYAVWCSEHAPSAINMVTELFTSGTLRQYRMAHPRSDKRAMRRFSRQLLAGVVHLCEVFCSDASLLEALGRVTCDEIYVNGYSGECKISCVHIMLLLLFSRDDDVGTPSREKKDDRTVQKPAPPIAAFLAWTAELVVKKNVTHHVICDPVQCAKLRELLSDVNEIESGGGADSTRAFFCRCLSKAQNEPPHLALRDLEKDVFFYASCSGTQGGGDAMDVSMAHQHPSGSHCSRNGSYHRSQPGSRSISPDADSLRSGKEEDLKISSTRLVGEDYDFRCVCVTHQEDTTARFVITMTPVVDEEEEKKGAIATVLQKTIEFPFDMVNDDADSVAHEIADNFSLQDTDTDICAAALKECLCGESDSRLFFSRRSCSIQNEPNSS